MFLRRLTFLLCLFLFGTFTAHAAETPAEHAANVYAQQELESHPLHGNIPDYSLAPADLEKSHHLSKIEVMATFVVPVWGLLTSILFLAFGGVAWIRDRAVAFSKYRWIQCFYFLLLFLLAEAVLSLPVDLYAQHVERQYGISVQGWWSWFGDQGKGLGVGWPIGVLIVMLLFFIIRKFPKKWWLAFWIISVPLTAVAFFAVPYSQLLFYKFEPLQLHHPELVAQLQKVVDKGHMDIPPSRMYLMKASDKLTVINAYVAGFGASKRVVVWDTSLAKGTPDEILFIFGHESGHYVLGHIESSFLFALLGLFFSFWIGYHFIQWAIARYGAVWRIPSQDDWGTLAILLLAFSIVSLFTKPIESTFSRHHEHQADIYGQEVIHGLVPDPQATVRNAFDALGQNTYSDPNPNRFYEFWSFDHPALGRRAAFGAAYNPWAPGMEPKYFKK